MLVSCVTGYSTMNTLQIAAHLQTLPILTKVCAADQLPNTISVPCGVIVNSDPQNKPGEHWTAIYIDKFRIGEYFCSYGYPPIVQQHRRFLSNNCRRWTHSSKEIQDFGSSVCGQYCLLYLLMKAHGRSLADFQNLFTDSRAINDKRLTSLFQRRFKELKKAHVSSSHRCQNSRCRTVYRL